TSTAPSAGPTTTVTAWAGAIADRNDAWVIAEGDDGVGLHPVLLRWTAATGQWLRVPVTSNPADPFLDTFFNCGTSPANQATVSAAFQAMSSQFYRGIAADAGGVWFTGQISLQDVSSGVPNSSGSTLPESSYAVRVDLHGLSATTYCPVVPRVN